MDTERDPHELRRRNEARCRRILETCQPLPVDDLSWTEVGSVELEERVTAALVYMRDVEDVTDGEFVGLTGHRSTRDDPLIAQFLDVRSREEASHADAIERYLHVYDAARSAHIPRRRLSARAAPTQARVALLRGPVAPIVAGAQMVWEAANELLTLNGYRLLAARCNDPVLSELLRRIAAQEARHYSFYMLQAEWRLGASPTARRLLRRVLRFPGTPVGVGDGDKSRCEFRRVLGYLGAGDDGERIIDRIDHRLATLPGFAGLSVYRDAVATSRVA